MKLRRRVLLYGACLFVVLSALLLIYLRSFPWWFILSEMALVVLAVYGYRLANQVFGPLDLLAETTQLISEQEFTTRLRPVGHNEMDQLIEIYNEMSEILRRQRLDNLEQASFLTRVLDTTRTGIVIFDFDGLIERTNPAAATFLDSEPIALQGQALTALSTPLAESLETLEDGQTIIVNYRGRRRLKCTQSNFLDRGFSKSYIFIDELTEELRHIEKSAYEKLIRVMSHEINNSLGASNSLLHSCLHYAPQIAAADRDDYREALSVVISRTDHLKTFVSNYVDVVKLPKPDKAPTHLGELLEHVRRLLSNELARRNIVWQTGQCDWPHLHLDRLQMEQAFLNIAKNAMEAIGEDGCIDLSIIRNSNRHCLIIADSGPGIPAGLETNLFTPFFTSKSEGQGIGLTLVAEILTNHGFDFSLESPPDEPTRFTIWF